MRKEFVLGLCACMFLFCATASAMTADEFLNGEYQKLLDKIAKNKATPDADCPNRLQRYEGIKANYDKVLGNPAEKTAVKTKLAAYCDSQCKTGSSKFTYNNKEVNALLLYTLPNPGKCKGEKPDSGSKWYLECDSCKSISK